MPSPLSFAALFSNVTTGTWIDIACLVLVVAFAVFDAIRGFSTTLSILLGLLIAVHAGYWLYPAMRLAVGNTAFCRNHAQLGAILPYVLAVLLGGVIFIAIRFIFRRFFKLIVERPLDNILGAFAGIGKSMLVILIIFSCASLLPAGSVSKAFYEESRTGRCVVPVLYNVFTHVAPATRDQKASDRKRARKERERKEREQAGEPKPKAK